MSLINTFKLQVAELMWRLPRFSFPDAELNNLARQIVNDGCCAIEGFLPDAQVDQLAERALHTYEEQQKHISIESNGADQRIYGVDRLDSAFVLEKELAIADRLFQGFDYGRNKAWFQMLGKITYKEGNLGSGSGWHRDSPFTHQFKAILYLTDVTEENGPFEYIKGTHHQKSLRETAKFLGVPTSNYRFTPEQIINLEDAGLIPKRSTITGKKGTLLLADVRGLHRGKPLLQGQRMAITRYYFSDGIPSHFSQLYPQTTA